MSTAEHVGNMKHILLYGRRRSGRSAMIRALLELVQLPVSGYETRTLRTNGDGYHEIYLFPYGSDGLTAGPENHVGDCNKKERVLYPEVFDTLGVQDLEYRTPGVLVMDEIGFMETEAERFCQTVLERLNGNTPVLAAVRAGMETPFLREVLACENALVVEMEPGRFDSIYQELAPIVAEWNRKETED